MVSLIRTNSESPDFASLVILLDAELRIRDGEDHSFYAQFNKIDSLNEVVVAYSDEIAIGCGAIKPYTAGTVEVKRMFVRPEHRGKRVAGRILDELEAWAKELNFVECILETGFKQPEAIALYIRSYYKMIPNYGQYIGIENSICMRKTLR